MAKTLVNGFRDRGLATKILGEIRKLNPRKKIKFMHICGSHERTVAQYGLRALLPENIEIISGPGCPVCVSSAREIDEAIEITKQGAVITTFGDMLHVPGTNGSLADARMNGADVRVVYGVNDAVEIARRVPDKHVAHMAIGFETTAPTTAAEVLRSPPENFSLLISHRLIPPAMEFLLNSGESEIGGFICPGHVSTVIGSRPYGGISKEFKVPQVIAGFEPLDVLMAILMLLKQITEGRHEVEIEYTRSVKPEGNQIALKKMKEVFDVINKRWRGFPEIPKSGLELKREFELYDARKRFDIHVETTEDLPKGCRCGEVLRGLVYPQECPLFGKACTPLHPIGPCAVSSEGACSIAMKFGKGR
jgi:hydrogenase expression/formation protein HypD